MGSEGVIQSQEIEDVEDTIFVAVGKNVKENKSLVLWAGKRFPGWKLCFLHVHEPAHFVAFMDEKLSSSKLKQQAIKAYRDLERQKMHKLITDYNLILEELGVQAASLCIEMDNIEKGIVQTVSQHGIRWLVMGAAGDKLYTREMSELESGKATFVCQQAPVSCHIWFVCKGHLIYTRLASIRSDIRKNSALSSPSVAGEKTLSENDRKDANEDGCRLLEDQTMSTDGALRASSPAALPMDHMREDLPSPSPHDFQDHIFRSSSNSLLEKGSRGQSSLDLKDKLDHTQKDAEILKRRAFEKSVRRWKAEENAKDALEKAEESESLLMKELALRKEMEETLSIKRQELERMKNRRDQIMEELQGVRDQNPALESQISKYRAEEEELEEKIIQAVKLLITFKERRDKVKVEHESALREISKLSSSRIKDAMSLRKPQILLPSFKDIIEATQNFDPSRKIGEGRFGSVFKGLLRHVKVAIKMLPSLGSQEEFEHKLEALSRVRHPNLVTLIGTCPESRSLIYEYVENGSLEDCLVCQGKIAPLPWHIRMKILIKICSALIFLHCHDPCIVHGNLKPTNVLLDANHVPKLSDFGFSHLIPCEYLTSASSHKKIDPNFLEYMDPDYIETGEPTLYSDIYSFGVVLLRILTGRPASGLVKNVKCALECGNFNTILDFSAGKWPVKEAKQLAYLALKCCEKNPLNRPDLATEVWTTIEPWKDLSPTSHSESEGPRRIPSHFQCPIFKDVMTDPYIAADGFTYEADAIKGWLNSGHKTSPMTNLKLDHCDLLPNYALYQAIQEWTQQY